MTVATPAVPSQTGDEGKGLKGGALGLISSVVIGVSSTAPAYSLAASLGFIVASGGALLAGVHSPGIILLAFVPMYLIAVAYQELNKAEADCGTTFTWASRAFGPIAGWMGGWGIIVADIIVMANLAQIAGQTTFSFLGNLGWTAAYSWSGNVVYSTIAGVVWIAIMTLICYRGIEVSARLQYVLLAIEVVVLLFVAVFALVRVANGTAPAGHLVPNIDWFNPFGLNFANVIAPAMLTAIFIYWGWDTAVSVNEETADPQKTPGRAAIISTVLLLITYAIVAVAVISYAGTGLHGIGLGNANNADNVFTAIGTSLFGTSVLGHIAIGLLTFSILTSASASTQTTILPTARTSLSMAVYKAIPEKFARIHPRFLTPTWSTVGMGIISVVFYVVFTLISPNLLSALIGSIGLMIAFYYGLTGFACVWFYRKTLTSSVRNFVMRGLFPSVGGLMLAFVFVYGLSQFLLPDWLQGDDGKNVTIFGFGAEGVVGIIGLLVGVVLMVIWYFIKPDFFKGKTLERRSDDLLLAPGAGRIPTFGLPDSGRMPEVIAPDLSNLPAGSRVIDAATGEEIRKPGEGPTFR